MSTQSVTNFCTVTQPTLQSHTFLAALPPADVYVTHHSLQGENVPVCVTVGHTKGNEPERPLYQPDSVYGITVAQ